MKKIILILLIIIGISFTISVDANNDSKTLQDLLTELDALEQLYLEQENNLSLTEDEINTIKQELTNMSNEIAELEESLSNINGEVLDIFETIDIKEEQIYSLVQFIQQSSGENAYLEYAFGAESMTDFIFRYAVSEQLANYNATLVNDLNENILLAEQKNTEMINKTEELELKQDELIAKQTELGALANLIDEDAKKLSEEIQEAKQVISNYQAKGCTLNDKLSECGKVPLDNQFNRPLSSGVVTSNYGVRISPVTGYNEWHYAIDIGGNQVGTPIYSTASGVVVLVSYPKTPDVQDSSCGGNMVVIQHKINGVYYASRYLHLNEVYVETNQEVTASTVIGTVGGNEYYERCSTGPHLDFSIAAGLYGQDFYSFREPYTIDPATLIDFPPKGTGFNSRYTG